jgi:hypothetical protein
MLAFVHIPKTAGTTMDKIMEQSFGSGYCRVRLWPSDDRLQREKAYRLATARDIRKTMYLYPGLKVIGGHRVTPHMDLHEALTNIRFFAFFREPIARSASHYQFLKRNGNPDSLEEWANKRFYQNMQCVKIAGEPNAEKAMDIIKDRIGFVGLQEHFDESLVLLKKWAEPYALDIRYRSRNVLKNDHAKKKTKLILEDESRELLRSINEADIKLYDFVKEQYEQQVQESGLNLIEEVDQLRKESEGFTGTSRSLGYRLMRKGLYFPLLRFVSRGELVHDFSADHLH